jgi:magnesium transporter
MTADDGGRAGDELLEVGPRLVAEGACGPAPVAAPGTTIDAVREGLIGQRFEWAGHVVVCADRVLVGLARIEEVLAADGGMLLREVMDPDPVVLAPGVDEEAAVSEAAARGETAVAVVDHEGRFVGLIPPRRIIHVMGSEHTEDLARLGGYLASTSSARHAVEEPLRSRLGHRLPWLLVGLAGAVAAAGIVGAYERELERQVLLAFFVPSIVYMADAVGTQTEALVIRGMSVGVPLRRIVWRELLTGMLVGLVLAAAFVPIGLVFWHEGDVVAAVAIAILAACSTATLVAMALPWLLSRLDLDPAFGSGPLATVCQDLLTLVIYFWVASMIVG